MTFKIRVIGLEMNESVVLEIIADTTKKAMSEAEKEADRQQLKWDALEFIETIN